TLFRSENIASGVARLKLVLTGQDVRGYKSPISEIINREITWQGNVIQIQGESLIDDSALPELGDLSQLEISLHLLGDLAQTNGAIEVQGLESTAASELAPIEEFAQINTHAENSVDVIGSLDISSLNLAIDSDDLSGYALDENLDLSITKKFRIEFHPKIVLPGANILGQAPQALNHGRLKVRAHLYSPLRSDLNFEKPNLQDYAYIASDEQTVQIRADGLVSQLFNFSMNIARSPLLRLKN